MEQRAERLGMLKIAKQAVCGCGWCRQRGDQAM